MTPGPSGAGGLFPKTSWTLLAEARSTTEGARAARDELATRYFRPVRAYVSSIVRDPEAADDITQGFFEQVVLSGRLVQGVDRDRGGFRPFMKQALRNFVIDHFRRVSRDGRDVRPDASTRGWDGIVETDTPASAEIEYHNAWVRALLEVTLEKVRNVCVAREQGEHFDLFAGRYLCAEGDPPSWRDLGVRFGLDEKAARNRADTVARHFRLLLRRELLEETGSVDRADHEVAALLALL